MSARNRKAFEASQRARAAIRCAWARLVDQQPFRRYTAGHVLRELPAEFSGLSKRAVQWHMRAIATEAERGELGCVGRNSSDAVRSVP